MSITICKGYIQTGANLRNPVAGSQSREAHRDSAVSVEAVDYELKNILRHVKRPEICAPETYQELVRTPKMRQRLVALGFVKKPVSEWERRSEDLARLTCRYARMALYKQVWSQPVEEVAKTYGISGRGLAKACRKLHVPVPPRGYWARIRNGYKARKPPLPELNEVRSRLCLEPENVGGSKQDYPLDAGRTMARP